MVLIEHIFSVCICICFLSKHYKIATWDITMLTRSEMLQRIVKKWVFFKLYGTVVGIRNFCDRSMVYLGVSQHKTGSSLSNE